MLLFDILKNTDYTVVQGGDIEIAAIVIDSRRASAGSLFVCMKGHGGKVDGHDFINGAVANGATAVVCEQPPQTLPHGVTVVKLAGTRAAVGVLAANFYGRPAEKVNTIGVTGTKGKTSVTYFLEAILTENGHSAGVIGTTGARAQGKPIDIPFDTASTPDTIELHKMFAEMVKTGTTHCAMEATSHALALERTVGVDFNIGIFTNFSQDHLDFHITMEEYFKAKARLFKLCKKGVINIDDEWVRKVVDMADCEIVTFGIENEADYRAENVRLSHNHATFSVKIKGQNYEFTVPIPGLFTVYNILACVAACCELGVAPAVIQAAAAKLPGVPGRFESVENELGISIIVDYAHTPDSLNNIIRAVKDFTKGKVITVFGCGGDRDKGKRPLMGEIAGQYSDYCVLTSDNPRNEPPEAIIRQIAVGTKMTPCPFAEITDRAAAIEAALNRAKPGDSVIIAGKGHESYMEFEDKQRVKYNDIDTVRAVLKKRGSIHG